MAEAAADLAIGAITLPTVLSSCIELAKQISAASNVERDYTQALTELMLLSKRLRNWVKRRTILSQADPLPDTESYSDIDVANRALYHIQCLMDKASRLHSKYECHGDQDRLPRCPTPREAARTLQKASEVRQRELP